jgi:serine/threonine-protein kinase HipA
MAMALVGANRHYHWQEILRRHWISTAHAARFSKEEANAVLTDCFERVPEVVDRVSSAIPPGFPSAVADAILKGLESARGRLDAR